MRGGTPVATAAMGQEPAVPGGRGPARWWDLALTCGHTVRRPVRYVPLPIGTNGQRPRHRRNRDAVDILPAQEHAHCDQCPTAPVHDDTHIHIRAAPARAVAVVELLRRLDPALDVDPPEWRAGGFISISCKSRAEPAYLRARLDRTHQEGNTDEDRL